VTRAFGPQLGWIDDWAIFLADIIVMASLAVIASQYTFALWNGHPSNGALIAGAVIWISLMTWICYRGIELSARIQQLLLSFEVVMLIAFTITALIRVYSGDYANSIHISASWFNPFDMGWNSLIVAVLLGIFIYWGWDSGVAVNEESKDPRRGPGKAAVVSTFLLLAIYVAVTTGAQAVHGPGFLANPNNQNDVLNALGKAVFGGGVAGKLLILCVLTSASASTQTTILPTARTTLSMAKWRAIPSAFGQVHPRYLTPSFSTLLMGGLSILWTIALLAFHPNQDVLGDTISALGFSVCFYYGFTGLACGFYFRRELLKSVKNFVLIGLVPFVGGLMMAYVGIKSFSFYSTPGNNYSKPFLGIQTPIVVGIGGLILGVILMFASWPFFRGYFSRRPEVADPRVLTDPNYANRWWWAGPSEARGLRDCAVAEGWRPTPEGQRPRAPERPRPFPFAGPPLCPGGGRSSQWSPHLGNRPWPPGRRLAISFLDRRSTRNECYRSESSATRSRCHRESP
jgi:amino acid transporter